MSRRYGRGQKRAHLKRISDLEAERSKWSRRAVNKAWEVMQLAREVERWKPRIAIRDLDPSAIAVTVSLQEDTLRFAPDRLAVLQIIADQVKEDLASYLSKLRRF